MNPQITGTLKDVEAQFNTFCAAVDMMTADLKDAKAAMGSMPGAFDEVSRITTAVAKAAMFAFEGQTCERILKIVREEESMQHIAMAPMPFESVVLVDSQSATALLDVRDFDPEDNQGLLRIARSAVCTRLSSTDWCLFLTTIMFNDSNTNDTVFDISPDGDRAPRYNVAFGTDTIAVLHSGGETKSMIIPKYVVPLRRNEQPTPETLYAGLQRDALTAILTAVEQLWYINLPRHHIVEQVPHHVINNAEKMRRRAAIKLPRFNDRPRYILVEPEKVATIRPSASGTDGGGTHASPTPHFRAGYTRVLRSARFKHKRWAVVNVRPTWVGDEEWDFGKVRFRVISPGAKL